MGLDEISIEPDKDIGMWEGKRRDGKIRNKAIWEVLTILMYCESSIQGMKMYKHHLGQMLVLGCVRWELGIDL